MCVVGCVGYLSGRVTGVGVDALSVCMWVCVEGLRWWWMVGSPEGGRGLCGVTWCGVLGYIENRIAGRKEGDVEMS